MILPTASSKAHTIAENKETKNSYKQITSNKKVLLRERKRHTDRSVSSTPYAVLSRGTGGEVGTLGYPLPPVLTCLGGRGTYLGQGVGTLGYALPVLTWPEGGVPTLAWGWKAPWGTPSPVQTWPGGRVPTLAGGRYLGVPPSPILTWPGGGVPTLTGG